MLLRLLEKPWKISSKGVSDIGQKIYEEEKRIYIYIYIVCQGFWLLKCSICALNLEHRTHCLLP